jgi:hypothetical protein
VPTCGFDADLNLAMRVTKAVAQSAKPSNDRRTTTEDLFEHLLGVLRGSDVYLLCSLPVKLVDVWTVVVRCPCYFQDVLADRFEKGPRGCYCAFRIRSVTRFA